MSHTRTQIAPGIYRDRDRLLAEVRIGNSRDGAQARASKAYPLGTDLDVIRAWIHTKKGELLVQRPDGPPKGSLAADIKIFLQSLPEGRYRADHGHLLAHWTTADVGALPRSVITGVEIEQQIARWQKEGRSPVTLNHRLRALRNLYKALDGSRAAHPTDKITYQRVPHGEARAIPMPIVKLILAQLTRGGSARRGEKRSLLSKASIRLRVQAYTGAPPAQIKRLVPGNFEPDRGRLYLPQRQKGKGAAGRWVDLIPDAVAALEDFAAANLWGKPYSNSSVHRAFKHAITAARAAALAYAKQTGDKTILTAFDAVPANCRPYDLRHSFATEVYRITGDLYATAELLQHADLETTKHYAQGAVSERVQGAIAKLGAAVAASPSNIEDLIAQKKRDGFKVV